MWSSWMAINKCEGRSAFRERYRDLFARVEFGGTVPERLVLEGTCVDLEHYWRIDPDSGEHRGERSGFYTLREKHIGHVRFIRP